MPALDLELNSSAFLSGASAVNSSIDSLIRGSGSLDNALLAVGQSLQNFSQVGREIRDVQGALAAKTGQTVTVMGALGSAIKANPIFAIATVLGVAATAMQLFASSTDKAAEAQQKLAASIKTSKEAMSLLNIRSQFGGNVTPGDRLQVQQRRLEEFLSSNYSPSGAYLNRGGGPTIDEVLGRPLTPDEEQMFLNARRTGGETYGKTLRFLAGAELRRTYDLQRLGRAESEPVNIVQDKGSKYSFGKGLAGIGIGRGISPDPFGANGDMGGISTTVEQSLRAMQEMRLLGEDIGQTLGNAFDRATQAGATFKSVLQGVLQDLRSIATSLVSSWLRDSVGSAFGGTPRGR